MTNRLHSPSVPSRPGASHTPLSSSLPQKRESVYEKFFGHMKLGPLGRFTGYKGLKRDMIKFAYRTGSVGKNLRGNTTQFAKMIDTEVSKRHNREGLTRREAKALRKKVWKEYKRTSRGYYGGLKPGEQKTTREDYEHMKRVIEALRTKNREVLKKNAESTDRVSSGKFSTFLEEPGIEQKTSSPTITASDVVPEVKEVKRVSVPFVGSRPSFFKTEEHPDQASDRFMQPPIRVSLPIEERKIVIQEESSSKEAVSKEQTPAVPSSPKITEQPKYIAPIREEKKADLPLHPPEIPKVHTNISVPPRPIPVPEEFQKKQEKEQEKKEVVQPLLPQEKDQKFVRKQEIAPPLQEKEIASPEEEIDVQKTVGTNTVKALNNPPEKNSAPVHTIPESPIATEEAILSQAPLPPEESTIPEVLPEDSTEENSVTEEALTQEEQAQRERQERERLERIRKRNITERRLEYLREEDPNALGFITEDARGHLTSVLNKRSDVSSEAEVVREQAETSIGRLREKSRPAISSEDDEDTPIPLPLE